MKEISDSRISFRKLFDVKSYPEQLLRFFVAVSGSGDLLYITEEVTGMGITDMGLQRHIYRLDKAEFRERLEQARRNGKLQKAIRKGDTTLEEVEKLSL
ncbi:MAG: hypothetical protein K6E36_06140 [Oscillospiraceae bacterium]|nr:hypothetical protein [Oscillospiraceae bacterium]MCR5306061.1 hypothetical protein [Oscillospiraceae bacterium]